MLKMVDGTGIIGVDMICPLGVSTPQPPNYDRVELEGAGMLVLPNSLDAPLERLELGGKTEQFSAKGLNLFNYKDFVDISTYADEGAGYRRKYLQLKPNTSYRMTIFKNRMSPSMDATVMFIGNKEKYDNTAANGNIVLFTSTDKKSATIVTGESGQIVFKLNKNSTPELQEEYLSKADIILSEGSTEIPYEPYTGGKPSPSPEYPQEIKNSGKWNEEKQKYEVDVKITGKNLFDMNKFIDTCNFTKNEDGTFRIDKYVERYDCFIPANTILSIEVLKVEDSSGAAALELFYEDGKSMYIGFGLVGVKTFLIQKDVAYIKVLAYRKHEYKYIQLEKGRTATPYEPYKEQTLTLTSDRPLTKWDRLVEQGGEIGWLYGSVIATIDETASISLYAPNGFYVYVKNIDKKEKTGYCDKLYAKRMSNGEPFVLFGNANNNVLYTLNTQEFYGKTVSEIKEKLKEYPLNIIGKSETTEFVPLPQSEQNAIRALKAYYPTTVITVDGGELDPDIKVTYRKEK